MNIRMRHLALIGIAVFLLAACRNDGNQDDRTASASQDELPDAAQAPADATASGADASDAMADATMADPVAERSALGVLNAINDHEIAAGRQALEKNVRGEVAEYAQMMIDEHSKNREKTMTLSPDADSADARAQAAKGEQQLQALASHDGEAYSRAYVDAMVMGHTDALAALDQKLIPAATTPEVAAHLRTSREHVAQHLERAKQLQSRE